MSTTTSLLTRCLFASAPLGAVLFADASQAQSRYFFSVNWHGPSVGAPDALGTPMTEGDILRPFTVTSMPVLAPSSPPNISYANGPGGLGLTPGCVGHPGGTPCTVEVDAFSRGGDKPFDEFFEIFPGDILFTVDEFARGMPSTTAPNVFTEAMAREAAPDAFFNLDFLPPIGSFAGFGRNVGAIDGDGLASASGYAYPGTGLIEPNTPFGGLPDTGDNKDALDLVEATAPVILTGPYYFSLDAAFVDVWEGVPNSGSAAANGFVGADVLRTDVGGPVIYAPASILGLDLVGGPGSDDLDALILSENGNGTYDFSFSLYDWNTGVSDMLVFSVRRGSAVIGMPDSIYGRPIEEGDLLIPPTLFGVSPYPGIIVPAEALGLATARAGFANIGDDLNGADTIWNTANDCDGDGIEDAIAIANGLVPDVNINGVPDSCESLTIGTPFCLCVAAASPCGNASPSTGCLNVTGLGALLTASGSTSALTDDLVLTTTNLPPFTFCLTFMASSTGSPTILGNGLRCLAGSGFRFPIQSTGSGTSSIGTGLRAYTLANNPPAGWIVSGSTWNFQNFYRDVVGPCGSFINLSNGLSVTFTP